METARIRTAWKHKERKVSVEEFANALSAICWRVAVNAAKNLHAEDFRFRSDRQRVAVVKSYLYFFIHCADRLTHDTLSDTQRQTLITGLSLNCISHLSGNASDLCAEHVSREDEINTLNEWMKNLSVLEFAADEPGYSMYRALGARVLDIMGDDQTNRWVIDQVMDIDGPMAYRIFRQSLEKLKRNAKLDT